MFDRWPHKGSGEADRFPSAAGSGLNFLNQYIYLYPYGKRETKMGSGHGSMEQARIVRKRERVYNY